jgi:hypothetical protein
MKPPRFLLALITIPLLLSACNDEDHEFTAYSGAQQKWAYAPGAFVSTVAGMPVYQGACNRPYTVIGKLTVNRRRGDIVQEGVVNEARRYGADGLIVVSSQTITDGAVGMSTMNGSIYSGGFAGTGFGVSRIRRHREAEVWLIKFS